MTAGSWMRRSMSSKTAGLGLLGGAGGGLGLRSLGGGGCRGLLLGRLGRSGRGRSGGGGRLLGYAEGGGDGLLRPGHLEELGLLGRRVGDGVGLLGGLALPLALELLDHAGGVDELLLAGVERVAVRADFDGDLLARGAGRERVPAAAGDERLFIVGVDVFLHGAAILAKGLRESRGN